MKEITITLTAEQAKLVHEAITLGQSKILDMFGMEHPDEMQKLNELNHIKIDLIWNQLKGE